MVSVHARQDDPTKQQTKKKKDGWGSETPSQTMREVPNVGHSSCAQRVHSVVLVVRRTIDALLADVVRVGVLTPLNHLERALALPLCMGISRPPEMLRRVVHRSRAFGHLGWKRMAKRLWLHGLSNVCWTQRGSTCRNSYRHTSVKCLGPKRNLLLVREMLVAARYADNTLETDLAQGFPLINELPSQWHFAKVSYPLVEKTRKSLLWQAGWRNDEIPNQVAASFVSDVEDAAELDTESV